MCFLRGGGGEGGSKRGRKKGGSVREVVVMHVLLFHSINHLLGTRDNAHLPLPMSVLVGGVGAAYGARPLRDSRSVLRSSSWAAG